LNIELPGSEEDIVTFLYNVILKRDPDRGGLENYSKLLKEGKLTPYDLSLILYLSDENKQKRQLFRDAANLALADFLNQIKGTNVYNKLNEIAENELIRQDKYDSTVEVIEIKDGSFVVSNVVVPPFNGQIFTTSKELAQYLLNLGYTVTDKFPEHASMCYLINPEYFDNVGILIRRLDRICESLCVTSMLNYAKMRSQKVVRC